ncbi:potassium-transporting ATPase subunit C [Lactiplantibacillus plantarum]|nr:potassium-transporting ATPase subunit C [Lactiplantibacillus plantarum]
MSPTAAKYQVKRIAKARHVSVQKIQRVIDPKYQNSHSGNPWVNLGLTC